MVDDKKPKKGMFAKIENRDDALKTIRDTSIAFLVVAGIQGAIVIFLAPSGLLDAALYVILGLILMKWKSRTAAVLLLLLSGLSAVVTVMNKLGLMSEGGSNILLALIVFWAAVRAVEATFKLHGKFAKEQPKESRTSRFMSRAEYEAWRQQRFGTQ